MKEMIVNRNIVLSIIALAVVGIFVILFLNYSQRSQSPSEEIANSIGEATEELSDEIDDHTTSK